MNANRDHDETTGESFASGGHPPELRGGGTGREDRATRIRVDLRRLPRFWYWLVALVVTAGVAWLAWKTGQPGEGTAWVRERAAPVLGWVWIGLVVVVILTWPLRRKGKEPPCRR